tara:strand:- start:491 stop:712 length:222 start_codon:yes stop_codon:yes gene_type:complete
MTKPYLVDQQEQLADDIAKTGEKRGVDELLGIDTEPLSIKQIRKLLIKKGFLPRRMNMGGVIKGRGGSFKGTR